MFCRLSRPSCVGDPSQRRLRLSRHCHLRSVCRGSLAAALPEAGFESIPVLKPQVQPYTETFPQQLRALLPNSAKQVSFLSQFQNASKSK